MLYKLGKVVLQLCSFCMKKTETSVHLFHTCTKTNILFSQIMLSLQHLLTIPPVVPNSVIISFTDLEANYQLINHFLLILKYYVYKAREN